MAELFQRDKSTISRHIKNIFSENELQRESVVANFATTATDGKTYHVDYYNLDVIISVGYRVKSKRGTQFRIWATNILKEYMKKGFALDDDRMKNLGGGGYFKDNINLEDYLHCIFNVDIDIDDWTDSDWEKLLPWNIKIHTAGEQIFQVST